MSLWDPFGLYCYLWRNHSSKFRLGWVSKKLWSCSSIWPHLLRPSTYWSRCQNSHVTETAADYANSDVSEVPQKPKISIVVKIWAEMNVWLSDLGCGHCQESRMLLVTQLIAFWFYLQMADERVLYRPRWLAEGQRLAWIRQVNSKQTLPNLTKPK